MSRMERISRGRDDDWGSEEWSLTMPPGRRTEQSPRQQHPGTAPAPQSPPPRPQTLLPRQEDVDEDDKMSDRRQPP